MSLLSLGCWPFQPTIDGPGGVIPDLPVNSWAKGNVLRIPLLTGFNTNEVALFVPRTAGIRGRPLSLRTNVKDFVTGDADLAELWAEVVSQL